MNCLIFQYARQSEFSHSSFVARIITTPGSSLDICQRSMHSALFPLYARPPSSRRIGNSGPGILVNEVPHLRTDGTLEFGGDTLTSIGISCVETNIGIRSLLHHCGKNNGQCVSNTVRRLDYTGDHYKAHRLCEARNEIGCYFSELSIAVARQSTNELARSFRRTIFSDPPLVPALPRFGELGAHEVKWSNGYSEDVCLPPPIVLFDKMG